MVVVRSRDDCGVDAGNCRRIGPRDWGARRRCRCLRYQPRWLRCALGGCTRRRQGDESRRLFRSPSQRQPCLLGTGIAARICRSRALTAPAHQVSDPVAKSPTPGPRPSESFPTSRVRITRLHNGSILCCRELRLCARRRTALGHQRRHGVGRRRHVGRRRFVGRRRTATTIRNRRSWPGSRRWFSTWSPPNARPVSSWIIPSFPPFLTSQPLRC